MKHSALKQGLQTALRLVYPPRCIICGQQVMSDFGLCGPCWRDTPFISGLCCDACGAPLPGEDRGETILCDECLRIARPWSRGRAAMIYKENGRKLVLAFKHGDRHDVIRPAATWLARSAGPILSEDMLIVPIPLHWRRLLRRRFNQSALLSQAVARNLGMECCPDALRRVRHTSSLDGKGRDERFRTLEEAIKVHPGRASRVAQRRVLLVDDVMTSGATFAAAAEACYGAGAREVCVLTLARVVKDA
ncbi:double zinc ribbon domain-containing protein [Roseovarius sp. SYSU LYC5161]|uniref:double zinc ribbon domain-containing protein n=1 Tax=Roseovarius halophilus (ex Wu et al. 2025) TaxID=3376060 RepID=UPI00399A9CB2